MKVVCWDMDGVLIDSLGLDLKVINPMLREKYGEVEEINREFIRERFALAIPEFCRDILKEIDRYTPEDLEWMVKEYELLRRQATYDLCPGVTALLEGIKAEGFPQWVISNNKEADIDVILKRVGIREYFDNVWGYDSNPAISKKPAPDIYLGAFKAAMAQYEGIQEFFVFEDSQMGIESAVGARSLWNGVPVRVFGVGTGGDSMEMLNEADEVFETLKNFNF
jgi:beta-phosphoglucomutase-like phosphatase (HAD superfamily)